MSSESRPKYKLRVVGFTHKHDDINGDGQINDRDDAIYLGQINEIDFFIKFTDQIFRIMYDFIYPLLRNKKIYYDITSATSFRKQKGLFAIKYNNYDPQMKRYSITPFSDTIQNMITDLITIMNVAQKVTKKAGNRSWHGGSKKIISDKNKCPQKPTK